MKTAIIYASKHHGNTYQLVKAISERHPITEIHAEIQSQADLSDYDLIGFASGIDFGRFYPSVEAFLRNNLPANKQVFFLYTCAKPRKGFTTAIEEEAKKRNAILLGEYGCRGYNTYGPWKLVGGMNRNHPTKAELDGAVRFYESLLK
ncbi:MAG: flavodoxin [Ruminiclostridium sp.]|nr:flavodoxin [Ruminiclostridium sp.]